MNKRQTIIARQPFSAVWQAAIRLSCAERHVYHHVQAGRLPLAFNIARPGGERHCLRMATASVVALQRKLPPPIDLAEFLDRALPETQFSYKVSQLARLLLCDTDHLYYLIKANELQDIGGSVHYRIPRESVIRFLTERRLK